MWTTTVTADRPLYAVFQGRAATHLPRLQRNDEKLSVHFSDGAELKLAPHRYGYLKKEGTSSSDD